MTNTRRMQKAAAGVGTGLKLFMWGANNIGVLGDGTTTNRSSMVQIGGAEWLNGMTEAFTTMAVKADYSLWGWGENSQGELGVGDTTDRSSPVRVGSLNDWKEVFVGHNYSHAIKTDGTLWAWGANTGGQAGDGTTTNRSSPVQIGSLTTWSTIGHGRGNTMAVKTDGTFWYWGGNGGGANGDGTTTAYSSPVQFGSATNWTACDGAWGAGYRIGGGVLWSSGDRQYGGLALIPSPSNRTNLTAAQVGSPSAVAWRSVRGGTVTGNGTRTDNTLWTWAVNYHGELGHGDTVYRWSPVQVGALTNWAQCGRINHSATAVKTDGTLWGWGRGSSGQKGNNTTTDTSSPIQIGSLTSWVYTSANGHLVQSNHIGFRE